MPSPDVPTRPVPPWPSAHIMALAPLDVWLGVLIARKGLIHPRYWLRVAWCLFTSSVATAITLPERLIFRSVATVGLVGKRHPDAPALVVLGYFRSGTTHLHYLLSCDDRFATPKWYQCGSPQGWSVSWWVMRWLMVPFLSETRPQDDVAFGPDYPAEEDFALLNWNLSSSMVGRFVLPQQWGRWQKWHYGEGLSAREHARFVRTMREVCWKVTAWKNGGGRVGGVLLKSPTNTARVGLVREALGPKTKFVHLSREKSAVVSSNVRMYERLVDAFAIENTPTTEILRARIVDEYDRSEAKCASETKDVRTSGDYAELTYDQLVDDPMAHIERIYSELGMELTDRVRERMERYLATVARYRATHASDAQAAASQRGAEETGRLVRGVVFAAVAAAGGLAAWLTVAHVFANRFDFLMWPLGVVVGIAGLAGARRGSRALGLWCAGLALAAVVASVVPMPEVANGWTGADRWRTLADNWGSATNTYVWLGLGVATAWRYGSRKQVRPMGV